MVTNLPSIAGSVMKLKTRILWLCAATLLGLVVLSAMALTTLYQ